MVNNYAKCHICSKEVFDGMGVYFETSDYWICNDCRRKERLKVAKGIKTKCVICQAEVDNKLIRCLTYLPGLPICLNCITNYVQEMEFKPTDTKTARTNIQVCYLMAAVVNFKNDKKVNGTDKMNYYYT